MNKACIFDFDGVIIDTTYVWEEVKPIMYREVYGDAIASQMTKTRDIAMDGIHDLARSLGSTVDKQVFVDACYRYATSVYTKATITPGLNVLLDILVSRGYGLAIVSASPRAWIETGLSRVPKKGAFRTIISLQDRPDLSHKPAPDGYIEAMKFLDADPSKTFIIEDSNVGLASAKAAGAITLALTQNNAKGYTIEKADHSFSHMRDIAVFIQEFDATG